MVLPSVLGTTGNTPADSASADTLSPNGVEPTSPRGQLQYSMTEALKRMEQRRKGIGDEPATPVPAASPAAAPKPKPDDDDEEDEDDVSGLLSDEEDEDEDKSSTTSDDSEARSKPEDDDPVLFEIDGAPVRKSEALKGYQRHQTFTKRTQELAEVRKSLETEAVQYRTRREQFESVLRTQFEAAQQTAPKPPDPALQATDPLAYSEQAAAYLVWRDQQQQRALQLQALETEKQNELKKLREAKSREESAKMLEVVPSLKKAKDDKQRGALMRAFRATAEAAGYSTAELKDLLDHRAILLLDWATRGRLRMNGKKTVKTTVPPVRNGSTTVVGSTLKGGSSVAADRNAPPPSVVAAEREFKRTGSIDAALALRKARKAASAS